MIDIKEITNGQLDGEIVFICDLRYDDYNNKPIRNIRPTRVLVRPNSETTKTIYYSESHFVGLNKKDKPLKSKIYPVFDNTGFRGRTGVPVKCFKTLEECSEFYKKQVFEAIEGLDNYKLFLIKRVDNKISELRKTIK